MIFSYILGIIFAVSAGALNSVGAIMQKKVVNEIPEEIRSNDFTKNLLKDRIWLSGFILSMGVGTLFFIIAQSFIGPALVPGLMASGLIIQVVGSVKIIGETEKLKSSEIVAILTMVIGIFLIGFSGLSIPSSQINLTDLSLLFRIFLFSVIIVGFWAFFFVLGKKINKRKGLFISVSGGFLFCLSNFWVGPWLASADLLFSNKLSIFDIFIFLGSLVILVSSNLFALRLNQEAYKHEQVNRSQPFSMAPTQIFAVFIYFFVYLKTSSLLSLFFIVSGIFLVLSSAFVLGNRVAEIETIE
jgi:hypothetical protein